MPEIDHSQPKPLLAVEQQLAHMKSKGITFDLCTETDAAAYLRDANNYLRTASYRKLYPVQDQGPHAGEYLGLDFEHLRRLSSLDRKLRACMRDIAIDVEHFAHMRVLRSCEDHGEDGYAIVADYLAQLTHKERSRIDGSLKGRGRQGDGRDEYSGDLIARYYDQGMPVWVLLELVEFGTLIDFYLFCAERWGDDAMRQEHYVLKSVKALRNACAHNNCIINGIARSGQKVDARTSELITASLNAHGLKRTKSRRAKLANRRVSQMAATLYASNALCGSPSTAARHAGMLARLKSSYESDAELFEKNTAIASFFDFLWKVVDIWAPARA